MKGLEFLKRKSRQNEEPSVDECVYECINIADYYNRFVTKFMRLHYPFDNRRELQEHVDCFKEALEEQEFNLEDGLHYDDAKDAGYAFDSYETISRYFDFLHELRAEQLDAAKIIEKCMRFEFKTVAETFHLIDNDMVPIYIPNAENAGLIAQIHAGELSRGLLRRLGRSSVNVYKEHLQNLYEAGVVENCNGIWILSDITAYDKECGLSLNKDAGAALWI